VRSARVPIVPGAILFDLLNDGDKDWGRYPPYRELGYSAAVAAAEAFALGSVGAGLGATTVNLKGGVGSAAATAGGFTVGALAAVNAAGSVTVGNGPWFWAAPYELNGEFGGLGFPSPLPLDALAPNIKGRLGENTTLVVVACDAALTKPQAKRLAIMAQDGLARAVRPVHTPLDGDIVFAAAIGSRPLADPIAELAELGAVAADVVARAIARAVYEAVPLPFPGALPSWRHHFAPHTAH
jgi:D-aminopeptidase